MCALLMKRQRPVTRPPCSHPPPHTSSLQGPISSKAIGEPPLLLSAAVLLALQAAARAGAVSLASSRGTVAAYVPLCAPATVEKVRALVGYGTSLAQVLQAGAV